MSRPVSLYDAKTHLSELVERAAGGEEIVITKATRSAIAHAADVYVSVVSACEMAIKSALGKLEAPEDVAQAVEDGGFRELPVHFRHVAAARELPAHHRDPFHRPGHSARLLWVTIFSWTT